LIGIRRRGTAFSLLLLGALAVSTCGKKLETFVDVPNQLPEVSITEAPIDTNVVCSPGPSTSCYAVSVSWIGFDADGAVDHYRYAVDPPSGPAADTVWQATRTNRVQLVLPATQEVPRSPNELPRARDHHVFVVHAVDNRGARGPYEARAFFAYTQAPEVLITDPLPNGFSIPVLTPSLRLRWRGADDDGFVHKTPIKYKYTLLTPSSDYPYAHAVLYPDSLRIHFGPSFSEWDSVGGDTTWVQFNDLSPNQEYLFVVVAFDEAGAYSPIFQLTSNMLRFRVGFASTLGPEISAFSEFFSYTWRRSYCPNCPSQELNMELPAGKALTVGWSALPSGTTDMRSFRWAVDLDDVLDDTPRASNEDWSHWSAPSLNSTQVTLPAYPGGEDHRLYIEATDNLGLRSLAVLHVNVIAANFRPGSVLIVKDMRFQPDGLERGSTCTARPRGAWPTQAELDTFLFARGGVPWKCYVPAVNSERGIFYGYSFDTIGTRVRRTDLTVRLEVLARYQHVVWIVDKKASSQLGDGLSSNPEPALHYMTGPGRFNSLAAYVKLGGKVWMVGGGAAFTTLYHSAWNRTSNDQPLITYSNALGELVPGRFMYDVPAWRTEFRSSVEPATIRRFAGRYEGRPPGAPEYTRYLNELPALMEFKTPETDPRPPYRTAGDQFHASTTQLEYLLQPTSIIDDIDPDPDVTTMESVMDTLYHGTGIASAGANLRLPLMTYTHGSWVPQGFVFTGFDIWMFKRTHCKAMVDFVLHRMWNLSPSSGASAALEPDAGRPRPR
jgi:hypothetical protein